MNSALVDNEAYIVSYARTPIGSFRGSLFKYSAVELGSHAVKSALANCALFGKDQVDLVYFGNVINAGLGQNVARQVAITAGIPNNRAPATTINKVCASGMKAIALAADSIRLGDAEVAIAGGTESMSNAPHFTTALRKGNVVYGDAVLRDSIVVDGLTDAFSGISMGLAAETTVCEHKITRQEQDAFAIESYARAALAQDQDVFANEIAPMQLSDTNMLSIDEEVGKLRREKVSSVRPAFDLKSGTITAANASSLADGAAALVLASGRAVRAALKKNFSLIEDGFSVYRIRSAADAEQEPVKFGETPCMAVGKALAKANLEATQIDLYEINEAFSCVPLANMKALSIPHSKVNVFGGAVAMGHPLGCSGARIVCTLCTALAGRGNVLGCASVCNGGGGASAIVVERVQLGTGVLPI